MTVVQRERTRTEREVGATIKLVLSIMEELAALDPTVACEPYFFEERRERIMRRLWIMAEACKRDGREEL
jgi:hypothetical protein